MRTGTSGREDGLERDRTRLRFFDTLQSMHRDGAGNRDGEVLKPMRGGIASARPRPEGKIPRRGKARRGTAPDPE
jgi:hypothetical protein